MGKLLRLLTTPTGIFMPVNGRMASKKGLGVVSIAATKLLITDEYKI